MITYIYVPMHVSKSAVPSIHNARSRKRVTGHAQSRELCKSPRDLSVNSMGALAQKDGLNGLFIQLTRSTEGDCSNKVQMGLLRACVEAAPCSENAAK